MVNSVNHCEPLQKYQMLPWNLKVNCNGQYVNKQWRNLCGVIMLHLRGIIYQLYVATGVSALFSIALQIQCLWNVSKSLVQCLMSTHIHSWVDLLSFQFWWECISSFAWSLHGHNNESGWYNLPWNVNGLLGKNVSLFNNKEIIKNCQYYFRELSEHIDGLISNFCCNISQLIQE